MTKQLVDLNDFESNKVDRLSKIWKLNKTDTIKRIIRDYPEQAAEFNIMMEDIL